MLAADIEATRYPRNPLDVLAQQLVAMTAVEEWRVEDLYASVRACANFADLSRDVFTAVLDLLAGRYPSDAFAGLRPRVVWDRAADTVRAREGAGRIAITSGGTIPDRGLFGVFMPDGTRVGELDEECVYESRRGEVILLGASAWRIEDITRDRVVVSPAPGEQGKLPFWKAPGPGRPIELGRAIGRFTRELRSARREDAMTRLRDGIGLDAWAAANLVNYIDEQSEATGGAVPDDRTIVVERFRDELGDWRVCILSPFGSRVHAPWSLAIEARVQERLGPGAQVLWSDDGIVLRLPEAVERIPVDDLVFGPEEIEETVVAALPGTAMFATVFREVAARALLLPRRRPGERTPLWQQRQRSADLLVEAARHPDFPMLLEATRECLRDVFDVPALREVMADLRARRTRLVAVDTDRASPFAQSLLFRWIAVYMYEGDAPLAERRAAALSLDRDLLRELLGTEELRELLDPRALDDVELGLQRLAPGRGARGPDGVHDLLRELGPMREDEVAARSDGDAAAWLETLLHDGRAIRVRVAGEERAAAVEDAARLRDALGVSLPQGLPAVFTAPAERPIADLAARYAPDPRSVRGGRGRRPATGPAPMRSGSRSRRSKRRAASSTARSGRAAPSASGATSTCSAGSGRGPSPRSAGRSSRSTRPRSAGSSRPGRRRIVPAAAPTPCPRRSVGSRERRCRPRSWRAMSCPRASAASVRPTSTRSARAASWSGWAPGRSARTTGAYACSSGNAPRCSCRACPTRRGPRARCTTRSARSSPIGAPASGRSSSRRPAPPTRRRSSGRSGIWSGRARSRTTRWRRCARTWPGRGRAGRAQAPGRAPARCGARGRPPGPAGGRSSRRCFAPSPPPPNARSRGRRNCSIATVS